MRHAHIAITLLLVLGPSAEALAWDPFVVENGHVQDGNERMASQDATGALGHYDQAARELPSDPGVHLNRGLALLEAGQHAEARDALELATQPPASPEIRSDAHYDIGLSYYREADAAANEENHEEAQRLFREAADAFRQSLRARPGNADAGWNLELALRRMREEQEQQEQEDQEQQDQEQQDQEQQDQQDQEQQDQQDQEQQDQQDQEQQDQEQQDQEQQDQEQQDQQDQDQQDQQDQQQPDDQQQEGDESSDQEDPSQEEPQDQQDGEGSPEDRQDPMQDQPPSEGTQERSLPPEHRRVLDALQDSEQNFERQRAAQRARRENRRVERDW